MNASALTKMQANNLKAVSGKKAYQLSAKEREGTNTCRKSSLQSVGPCRRPGTQHASTQGFVAEHGSPALPPFQQTDIWMMEGQWFSDPLM